MKLAIKTLVLSVVVTLVSLPTLVLCEVVSPELLVSMMEFLVNTF